MCERITVSPKDVISFDNYPLLFELYPPELYKKLASVLLLKRAGLPTLPGFVISNLDNETLSFLSNWAKAKGSQRLSLRFDSPRAEDHVRLSSLNPSLDELKVISPIIKSPIIGLVLAENDRYNILLTLKREVSSRRKNVCSCSIHPPLDTKLSNGGILEQSYKQGHSILVQFLFDMLRCEIVGPGFDAGDLTRGNVTPHESFDIAHKDINEFDSELSPIDILNHHIASELNYRESR